MAACTRLWGAMLAAGLSFPRRPMELAEVHKALAEAAARAGVAAMTVTRADLVLTQARPAVPPAPAAGGGAAGGAGAAPIGGPVLALAMGMPVGMPHGMPLGVARAATYQDVAPHLRHGDLLQGSGRTARHVARFEYL
jgi:hypothetical protein